MRVFCTKYTMGEINFIIFAFFVTLHVFLFHFMQWGIKLGPLGNVPFFGTTRKFFGTCVSSNTRNIMPFLSSGSPTERPVGWCRRTVALITRIHAKMCLAGMRTRGRPHLRGFWFQLTATPMASAEWPANCMPGQVRWLPVFFAGSKLRTRRDS